MSTGNGSFEDSSTVFTVSVLQSTDNEAGPTRTDVDTDLLPQQFDVSHLIKSWYPFIIVWMYLLLFATIPGNVLTLLAFYKNPLLRTPTNYLICNQSLADILVSVTANVFIWFNYSRAGLEIAGRDKYVCLVTLWSVLFGLIVSLLNIFALSTERLIAVIWPLQYFNWVTESSVCRCLGVIWMTTLVACSLPLMGWNTWSPGNYCMLMNAVPTPYYYFVFMVPAIVLLILTALFNFVIAAVAVKKNHIAPEGPASVDSYGMKSSGPSQLNDQSDPTTSTGQKNPRLPNSVNFRVTKMLLMVVGVFYLAWMPFLLMTALYFTPPVPEWKKTGPPEWYLFLHEVSKSFLFLNGICNPFIYAYKSPRFRIAFRKLLGLQVSASFQNLTF